MVQSLAPNPVRQRIEELAQLVNQQLRTIQDFLCFPVSVTHTIARQDVNLIATVLESGDSERFMRDYIALAVDRNQKGISLVALMQGLDCLEQVVTPRVADMDSAQLVWQSLSQARFFLEKPNGRMGEQVKGNAMQDAGGKIKPDVTLGEKPKPGSGTGPLSKIPESTQVELLKLVMSNIPQAIFWKDRNLVYLGCNQEFAKDAGLNFVNEIVGKTDYDMPWREQAELYRADDLAVMESGVAKLDYEEPQTTSDGKVIWLRTSKIPMRDSTGKVFAVLGMYEDITSRKRLEGQLKESLERRGYQVQVSTQIAQEIATAADLHSLFDSVVTLIKERFNYYYTQLLRYDAAKDAVVLVAGYGEVGQKMLHAGHQMPLGAGLIGAAAALGETQLRPSVLADPDWRQNPLLPETKGEIAVPIKLRGQVLGVLDVQVDQGGVLDEDDRLLLEGLCGQIAVAIESTRLRQEMEERLNELNLLYQATSREAWGSFREKYQGSTAYLYDQLEVHPLVEQLYSSVTADIMREVTDTPAGEIVIPLSVRGEKIGELGVVDDPLHPLSDEERRLIEQVSDQIAQSLESARLFEQTHASLAEARVLYTGSARIIAASNLDGVLNALVETTRLAELDLVKLELFDRPWDVAPPQKLVNAAVWSADRIAPPSLTGITRTLAELPLAKLLSHSAPLVIRDVSADERVDPAVRLKIVEKHGTRGEVYWPLVASGQWFGVVSGQSVKPLTLNQADIRQIGSLVAQAASAIQSMKLQEDMRARLQELTSLQRLMSRDAWTSYQAQKAAEVEGYLFDQVGLQPVAASRLKEHHPLELSHQPEFEVGQIASQTGYWAPLEVRGEPIGTLGVNLEPGRTLTEDEEAFLMAVSEQVAQALERARLMEQTQKSAVELQAVAEVGTATATILDPDRLLQEVVDLAKQRFDLYHAHIYLLDDAGENLVLAVGAGDVGRSMSAVGWSIPVAQEESLVARAARTRQGQVVNDVRQAKGYLPNPMLMDTLSEMAVPMVIGDRLLGVFDVQSDQVNRFHDEDVRIYTTLAAQIAVALQNANLYAEQLATVERLRELDNMKSAFLANMSHELRTPLNSILGFTQVVLEGLDGPLTDVMVADLELIEKNGKHLLNLINEVLDMAKIDSGRLSLNPEPLNLYNLMEDVIDTSGPLAREKSLFMRLDADPVENWEVMADHVRMRQIFLNLIGNAIKFTESGGITIQLNKLQGVGENQGDLVQLSIRDTGIGIPRNKLDEIFEAFTQVDSSTTRKVGGTGLGLPISRRLVELHGGRLWAESEGVGKGSTLILELPVGKAEFVESE